VKEEDGGNEIGPDRGGSTPYLLAYCVRVRT
jgi:hypothetical protein